MIGTVLSRDIVFAPMIVAVPMLNCLQVESCCDSYWAWQDKVCGDLLHFKFGLALFELLAFLVGLLSPCPNFLYRRGQLKACRNKETICVPKCMGIIRLWPWFLQAPMCSNCVGIHGGFFYTRSRTSCRNHHDESPGRKEIDNNRAFWKREKCGVTGDLAITCFQVSHSSNVVSWS